MCKTESPRVKKRVATTAAIAVVDGGVVLETTELMLPLGEGVKKTSELWHIHGRLFDLSSFMERHPGGSSILEAMRGAEDITPVFESYHALAHTEAIRRTLEKFEWTGKVVDDVAEREAVLVGGLGKEPVSYRWDEGGFYSVLKDRVKRHFLEKHGHRGVDPRKASINRFVKAPFWWYVKELFILAVYLPLFVYMLGYDAFRMGASLSGWARAGFAVLAGAVLQCFSFCTLHDASHYGLWFGRPRAQEVLSRVCNAWTLWHHGLWVMHHVYGHHSFTGDPERDPDLVHARPYLRKSVLAPPDQYDPSLVRWQRFLAPLFMMVMPGATLGQTQAYLRASQVGHLWNVSVKNASGDTRWYEYLTYVLAVGAHIVGRNIWVTFCYFMGISIAYHLCVAPDHDTFESSVVNSIEAKRTAARLNRPSSSSSSSSSSLSSFSLSSSSGREYGRSGKNLCRKSERTEESCRQAEVAKQAGGVTATEMEGVREAGDGACNEEKEHEEEEEEEEEKRGDDWGEVQVRHSGNFSNRNPFVTQAMGGINYQIEHHLFPSVSHMLYGEIAPIVRQACREFCIPYNAHPSLWSAYKSYLKHVVLCSEPFA